MPIWLRKLTYNLILEAKQKEAEAYKNKENTIDLANPNKANIPKEVMSNLKKPNYVTRASRK